MDGDKVDVEVDSILVELLGVSCFEVPANPGKVMRMSNKNATLMLMKKFCDEDLFFFMLLF